MSSKPSFEMIKETIKTIPHKPGVYRYYTQNGGLLYVGKAKDLKNRVSSYFQDGRPKNERLMLMISQIDRIEYTVVETEKESLILEANLINSLQPKFNILLKDDKNYVYVRITNDEIPGIFLNRRKYDHKSRYFGPYTKKYGIVQTLRVLRTIFPYCQQKVFGDKPCEYVSIHQCDGICEGKETIEGYNEKLVQIENVLKGKTDSVEVYIKDKINESVEKGNFELAALWRDRFAILEDTISDQKIILPTPQDIDLLTIIVKFDSSGLQMGSCFVQNIRDGRIVNVSNFLLSGSEENDSEFVFLERFLATYYTSGLQTDVLFSLFSLNQEGIIKKNNDSYQNKQEFEKLLNIKLYQKNIFTLNQTKIHQLQEQGQQNALVYLERNELGQKLNIFEENNLFTSVVDIQKILGLAKIPRRIECYDISHLSGTFVYGSMVVFLDGRPAKSHYKLFKTKEQNNDFENHKEVLGRRFERCLQWVVEKNGEEVKNPWQLPDLIIVDGGKGQLSGDLEVLEEYRKKFVDAGFKFDVEICSLAKREEEVFLPENSMPKILSGGSLFMVQRIRDEAHRFAITNNRNARLRTISKSELDDIPGIGSVTKAKLLKTFGSKQNMITHLTQNQELFYELIGENLTKKLQARYLVK
jgi:excinuclease ABC subunit C